jgi:hypothetical protein
VTSSKAKSTKRFEQLNQIVDEIAQKLGSSAMIAILLTCFRHAMPNGCFRVSVERIAKSSGMKKRQGQRWMDELESLGVIELLKEKQGSIPRIYRINFSYRHGVTHDTTNP